MVDKTIRVTRSFMPPLEEYIDEIKDMWNSRWLTNMGIKHRALQKAVAAYLNVENVELFTNGHMALELSMQALKLKGEVITTPFTFASTTHAIIRNGLEPVFCDINDKDFTIDIEKIESLITDKTCAIVPVHVYGNVCDIEKIHEIAKKYGLKVIYDAAHAFGVGYKGKGIGTYGDAVCFSFHATKVYHTIEGGCVCFGNQDKDFGLTLYRLKNFGIRSAEVVDAVGANAKMNEFCAAMGICNLRHIKEEIRKREALVKIYRNHLADISGLQLNCIQKNVKPNYAYFPIIIDEKAFGATRNEVLQKLQEHHIEARKYFYPLTNTFAVFHGKYNAEKTPIALHISKRILTLPLYGDLKSADVKRICEIVLSCKTNYS